jgi:hypothetical protein
MCRLKHEVALEPHDASFTSSLIGQNAPVALESEAHLAVCELAGRLGKVAQLLHHRADLNYSRSSIYQSSINYAKKKT